MEKLILPAIHFFALVGFIIYKAKAPFAGFMANRHTEMSDGLNRAKIQAAEVGTRKKEIEAKFANLQKEKDMIFSDWKLRESAQVKMIKDSSPKILAQMKVEAEQNKKSLEEQIRAQIMKKIAEQIVTKVEETVKAGLNPGVHQKINEQFMNEVSA